MRAQALASAARFPMWTQIQLSALFCLNSHLTPTLTSPPWRSPNSMSRPEHLNAAIFHRQQNDGASSLDENICIHGMISQIFTVSALLILNLFVKRSWGRVRNRNRDRRMKETDESCSVISPFSLEAYLYADRTELSGGTAQLKGHMFYSHDRLLKRSWARTETSIISLAPAGDTFCLCSHLFWLTQFKRRAVT